MGGRGTFAAGITVPYTYKTTGKIHGVKVLEGTGNSHGLPESSHSSTAYIKLKPDKTFHEMRLYDKNHLLYMEIAYHPEPRLTGNNAPVLHYHLYDSRFSMNKTSPFSRTKVQYLTDEMKSQYGKYFRGITL